ncbi:MAG: hypothetical protein OXR62_05035 [Ahrensia sp.]|nr:hypothetical protein [Ahrensia sp.]
MSEQSLPPLALSVRQPWAWAIIFGGKDIENRSEGSTRARGMDCRSICIHAASSMREKEYRWALWRLQQDGVTLPRPDEMVYGGIIGMVEVVDIVSHSDSPWFGGPRGLVLSNPQPIDPIPAKGELGYFCWKTGTDFTAPKPWMINYTRTNDDSLTGELFPDAPLSFREPPDKPFGRSSKKDD